MKEKSFSMKKPTDFIVGNNQVSGSWVILFFVFIIKKELKVKVWEELALKRKARLRWNERTNKAKHMMCQIACFKLSSKSPDTCSTTSPWFWFFSIWKFHLKIVRAFNTFLSFLDIACCYKNTSKQLILSCIQEILHLYKIPSTRICRNVGKAEHLI